MVDKDKHICKHCNASFSHRGGLYNHTKSRCPILFNKGDKKQKPDDKKNNICSFCGQTFAFSSGLYRHKALKCKNNNDKLNDKITQKNKEIEEYKHQLNVLEYESKISKLEATLSEHEKTIDILKQEYYRNHKLLESVNELSNSTIRNQSAIIDLIANSVNNQFNKFNTEEYPEQFS